MVKVFQMNSVIGLDKNFDIQDNEGNILPSGTKTVYPDTCCNEYIGVKAGGKTWFNHYNENLLRSIRDYQRVSQ